MSSEIHFPQHLAALRKKARLQLDELDPARIKAMTLEQISATVEELRIQQIQLEMQNTELIRTRNELEEARAGYFDLYEMAPMGYITLNQRGIVEQANLKAVSILGRDRTQVLDTPFIRFIAREDHHLFHQRITRVFQTQAAQTWESRLAQAQAGQIWVRLEAAFQTLDQGPVCRMAMSDITREKQALEKLQKNEARLRAITTSAHDAIIMMDHQGLISFWNPKAVEIFGYTPEQALGRDLHHLLAPKKYHKAYRENFPHFAETGHGNAVGRTVELEALDSRGRTFPVALSLSSVRLDGHWQAVGIVRDITELREFQNELTRARDQARASARSKSEFLANMSHEIRTPLNGIMGMMQILKNTSLDQEQEEFINLALTASDRLTRLLTDILELSRIEHESPALHPELFTLASVLEQIRMLFMPAATEKTLSWKSAVISRYLICFSETG
ncbi:MAG: PAS domain S-box protein [Desulfonatronovibrionaceae bacterium]